ncbi:Fc.00g032950.m01.CDS01 [Cosmosporella sp. VM-42]
MAQPVTEFSYFAAKAGVDLSDKSQPAYQALLLAVDTALSQPGAQRVYYGLEVENPSNVWLFLDWDRMEDHMNYRKTNTHGSMIETLASVLDFSKGLIKHVTVNPTPPIQVLDNSITPVTEVLSIYFHSDIDDSSKANAVSRLEEFAETGLKTSPDFKGISYGWSAEDDVPIRGEEDKTGSMLVAFIGWPSVEAHMKFRDTQEFKDSIGLLRNIPGLIKLGAFHVSCKSKGASDVE